MLVKKMPVYLNFKLLDRQIMTPQVLIPRQVNVCMSDIQVRQSPQDLTPLGVSFFKLKIRINRPNLNQNRKYYNPLVNGSGRFEWGEKLEVKNLVGLSLFLKYSNHANGCQLLINPFL